MSYGAPAAEASDAAEDPKDAPAKIPGEAPAEASEVPKTPGAAGRGPVGTPDATFRLRSFRVVREILNQHNDVKKVKRIIARLLRAQVYNDVEALKDPPLKSLLGLAKLLILQVQEETDQYLRVNKEKLTGLDPSWSKVALGRPGG